MKASFSIKKGVRGPYHEFKVIRKELDVFLIINYTFRWL